MVPRMRYDDKGPRNEETTQVARRRHRIKCMLADTGPSFRLVAVGARPHAVADGASKASTGSNRDR